MVELLTTQPPNEMRAGFRFFYNRRRYTCREPSARPAVEKDDLVYFHDQDLAAPPA
jgi:hypothetical protein